MSRVMRGVFAIPPTPFHPDGALDEPGLRNIIRFILGAGAHGVVTPVNASEFPFLTDTERQRVVEIAVSEVAGAVPVVAGVTAASTYQARTFARHASRVGADAIIAMPPYVHTATAEQIRTHYEELAAEAAPVFVQNHLPPLGTPMPPDLVAALVRDIDGVDFIKEECLPPGQHMSAEIDLAGAALTGVMGGLAGRYLLEEHDRGSCGTMPAGEIADVHVQLWNRLEEHDRDEAHEIFLAMLPLLSLESLHGILLYKEVLVRRRIIACGRLRRPGKQHLDSHDSRTLDEALAHVKPLFTVYPPDMNLSPDNPDDIDWSERS